LHPFCPFTTDFLYLSCFKRHETILMDCWSDKEILQKVSNHETESAFDVVKEVASLSYSIRNKSKLKRRWPLESAYIYCKNVDFMKIKGIKEILNDQLNIKSLFIHELQYSSNVEKIANLLENKAPILPKIDINRKVVAKKVKSDIDLLNQNFSLMDMSQVLFDIQEKGFFSCQYSNNASIDLTETDLDIAYMPVENYVSGEKENILLLINVSRNDDLIIKGLVRDLSRNLQQLRKELGFNPTEILKCAYISNIPKNEITQLKNYYEDIKSLVRVKDVVFSESPDNRFNHKSIDVDGKEIKIFIN
jgi:isoleucyl-tRNA synthetase